MSQFEISLNGSEPRVDLHQEAGRRKLAEKMGRRVVGPRGGGLKHAPEYSSWKAMWNRCTLESHEAYHRYGGAGITVCEEWKSFEQFFDDMGNRPAGTTLDRKDSRKGYFKDNCRWADRKTQGRNTRAVIAVEVGGISFGSIAEAAEYWGVKRKTLEKRIRHYGTPKEYWHLQRVPFSGDDAGCAKLSYEKATAIRAEYFASSKRYGMRKKLAAKYGVCATLIGMVIAGRAWV